MALDLIKEAGSALFLLPSIKPKAYDDDRILSCGIKGNSQNIFPCFFGITDETFSVISFNKEKISLGFVLLLNILSYASWNISIVGYGVDIAIIPTI